MKLEHGQKDIVVENIIEFLKEKMDSEKDVECMWMYDDLNNDTNLYSLFNDSQKLCGVDSLASKTAFINYLMMVLLDNNKLLVVLSGDDLDNMQYDVKLYKNGGDFTVETSDFDCKKVLHLRDKSNSSIYGMFYTMFGLNIPKSKINEVLKPVSLEQIIENNEILSK